MRHLTQSVVIGGSIAGLLTARVLADFCDSVIVVESDRFSDHPENRRGVPQSPQPHVLFTKGLPKSIGFWKSYFPASETI